MNYDANKHLVDFHDAKIFVPESDLSVARQRRQANRSRLELGLCDDNEPSPIEFVIQGSYAMGTMVKSEIETSDIDDGAVFDKEALKGTRGGDRSASDAKEMVRKAIADHGKTFKTVPEVRKNCVRVYYDDGFHVDIPVYRKSCDDSGTETKELASAGEWVLSDPAEITKWFNKQVIDKSPDETNGRQMRRIVRYLKYWSKSRSSWNMPSGFVISILVDEAYWSGITWNKRDDLALLEVMRRIRNRLSMDKKVFRPVSPYEEVTSERTIGRNESMCDELKNAIGELSKLELADCDEKMILKALKKLFNTDYWDSRIEELDKKSVESVTVHTPASKFDKRGGGMYA